MSRFAVWALLSIGSGLYNIPRGRDDQFAAAIWFGGMSLLIHWLCCELHPKKPNNAVRVK